MSVYQCLEPSSDRVWDAFVAGHVHGHVLQSSGWGRFRQSRGWAVRRLVIADASGKSVAGAQVLVRRSLGGTVGYVPRGPVCKPDSEAWPELLKGLRRLVGRRGVFVRIEPNWTDDAASRLQLSSTGLVETAPIQPPSTVLVDLAQDDDVLLGAMKQKWRYNVRLASRKGVTVRRGGPPDLAEFEDMLDVTAMRDGFPSRAAGYYSDAFHNLGPDIAKLYVAEHDGRTLAAVFVCHYGNTATYFYGASSNRERQRMPNHLLQWEAMREAKRAGCKHYDFWGIPDEIGRAMMAGTDPADVASGKGGLWGVWGFKRGFGGQVTRAVGAYDDVRSVLAYRVATRWLPRLRSAWGRRL